MTQMSREKLAPDCRDANITSPELRSILEDTHFLYEVKHNEDTILAAARLIDEKAKNG